MGTWQQVLSDAFAWAITLLVPAVVWGLVGIGLYQLVRDGVRSRTHAPPKHAAPTPSRALAKRSTG
jgi:hypothetical protein